MHIPEKPLRVLVVEDDPDTADAVRAVLSRWGHEARTAGDAVTGLDLAARFRPDLALLDLSLPDVDGFEVARRIRELPGTDPVLVAATGFDRHAVRLAAREVGFDHFLPKPFNLSELRSIVTAAARARADVAASC